MIERGRNQDHAVGGNATIARLEANNTAERCRASARPFDWESGVAPLLETIYEGRAVSPIAGEPALGG